MDKGVKEISVAEAGGRWLMELSPKGGPIVIHAVETIQHHIIGLDAWAR